MYASILEPLIKSPELNIYVAQLNKFVETENQKRQRFYEEITEDDKAEFINGEIVFQSPVKLEHNIAHNLLLNLISVFVRKNKLGFVGFEKILISLTRNDYEPDICFFNKSKSKKFHRKQMKFPAPDFIIEVLSPSTEEIDRGIKFQDYAYHSVREYWIVDPDAEVVEQYILEDNEYKLKLKTGTGFIKSVAIQNFEIPIRAIFDETENFEAMKEIMS